MARLKGALDAIGLAVREDALEIFDGETVQCPYCWSIVELVQKAELRKGRTYQVLQAEVVNVERYTVLMYWLVQQHIDSTGHDTVQFLPHAALLIDTDGKLRRFRARRTGCEVREVEWLPCARTRDPMQMPYYSWEAENNRKIGGWTFAYGPELEGHTGEKTGLEQYIVPYLMSSHPGCTLSDAVELAEFLNKTGRQPEQVQDFYPTPGTLSTCMWYTGIDPRTMEEVYVARDPHEKALQRALLQWKRPEMRRLVTEALHRAGRTDLIGYGKECLIRPLHGSAGAAEKKEKHRERGKPEGTARGAARPGGVQKGRGAGKSRSSAGRTGRGGSPRGRR